MKLINWVWPPPSNSAHQDYFMFRLGIPPGFLYFRCNAFFPHLEPDPVLPRNDRLNGTKLSQGVNSAIVISGVTLGTYK